MRKEVGETIPSEWNVNRGMKVTLRKIKYHLNNANANRIIEGWSIKAIILPVFLPLVRFSPSYLIFLIALDSFSLPYSSFLPSFLPSSNSASVSAVLAKRKDCPSFKKFYRFREDFLFFYPKSFFFLSWQQLFFYSFKNNDFLFLFFVLLLQHDVEEATSMEATTQAELNLQHQEGEDERERGGGRGRERERKIPFYYGFSLTNATQVRLFNAASVRSEAFSQDEWDDRLSPGTNSRKLRFIVAKRCLLPRYDTYGGSLTHSTNPLPSLRFSTVCNEIRMTITPGM